MVSSSDLCSETSLQEVATLQRVECVLEFRGSGKGLQCGRQRVHVGGVVGKNLLESGP